MADADWPGGGVKFGPWAPGWLLDMGLVPVRSPALGGLRLRTSWCQNGLTMQQRSSRIVAYQLILIHGGLAVRGLPQKCNSCAMTS